MILPQILALTTIPILAGQGIFSDTRSDAPEDALDLRVSGFPLQGQPLALEVRGPAATPFFVRVDVLPGQSDPVQASSAAIPGSRAASAAARMEAARSRAPFVLQGTTDAEGLWRQPLVAPPAGVELLVRGYALHGAQVHEFEALELTLLAPYAVRPGDVSVAESSADERGDAELRLVNHTDFVLELRDWTLSDERGGAQVLPEGTSLPAHGSTRVDCDAFTLDSSAELVLMDEAGRVIDRSSLALVSTGVSFGSRTPVGPGLGTRPCAAREDVPDLAFEDSNCDGIDGDIERAVFVATTGSSSNPGTMELPLRSINAAIAKAAADPHKDHVYVSEGTYFGLVMLRDGVSVWGGYSAANGWQRSSAYVTTFSAGGFVAGQRVGVQGTNLVSPLVLGSVTVATSTAPANGDNYGILLQNSDDVTLEAVTVVAGAGGSASSGASGSNGSNGNGGASGRNDGPGGAGGFGAFGGGSGGAGAIIATGFSGANGAGPSGGAGGAGGGLYGDGHAGGNGGAGAAGASGARGSNAGMVLNGFWVSLGDGGTGGTGAGGSGGGGGGGSGATLLFMGGGGGGGGGGGFGGTGSTGGTAGGSSFALFLAASHANLRSCDVTAGIGLNGGNGAVGGGGGNGGGGGPGSYEAGFPLGGNGGAGGKGGNGGTGAGGGGGHSYAILVDQLSSVSIVSSTLATSAAGLGGSGGTNGFNGEAVLVKQL